MNKVRICILLFTIILLTACKSIPEGFTEDEYDRSQKAVEIIDEFIRDKLDAAAAIDNLSELGDSLISSDNEKPALVGVYCIQAARYIELYSQNGDSIYEDTIKDFKNKISEQTDTD